MEIKEAVDVLGLVLSTQGREPGPEEIRRAGSLILDFIDPGVKKDLEGSKNKYEVEQEIIRALGYLDSSKDRLEGEALEAALELERELLERLGGSIPVIKEIAIENKHKVKIEQEGDGEDIRLCLRRKRMNLGLRQKDLAEELGISCAYLSLIERGKIKRTSRRVQERISAFLEEGMEPGMGGSSRGKVYTEAEGRKGKQPSRKESEILMHTELGVENKPEALKKLLEAALKLEGREIGILAAIAETWANKNKE
ncbi:MAG: helix-turn-helix domain-containing protein [Actinobacteria bacterium]|nr:helix-turn-helix domain-containing protein [Actinomycetota bacterium]